MNLGKDKIEAGDEVYDLVRKSGMVVKVDELRNQIVVRFGSTAEAYSSDGVAVRAAIKTRTLYWQNPIMFEPAKGDNRWRLMRALTAANAQVVFGSDLSNVEILEA